MAPLAANPLIQVTPGLMIWTIVCFLIALYVLKRYAFGPIQHTIDQRRERIRQSLEEADHAREEARELLEEHRKLLADHVEPVLLLRRFEERVRVHAVNYRHTRP